MASALLALSLIQTQAAPESPPPKLVVRISVELVQVDAIVTDSKGRHVADLHASDFEILEDGRPQEIANFAYEALTPEPAEPGTRPATAGPPSRGLRPDDVRRTVALVVNDIDLSFDDTFRVRRALSKFTDEQLGPSDLVAILRTSTGGGSLEQFSNDKDRLHAAIEQVKWGRGGWFARSTASEAALRPGQLAALRPGQAAAQRLVGRSPEQQLRVAGAMGTLSLALRALAGLPGRKALVFFSAGFDPAPADAFQPAGDVRQALQPLMDLANRASVVFYTVDPRGPFIGDPGGGAGQDFAGGSGPPREREQIGLRVMAEDSGGLFYGLNRMEEGLARVAADQKGYYLLGYVPPADTFAPASRNRFHKVAVKVKRPGLKVRSRKGFFGIGDADLRAARGRGTLLERALSPFAAADLHLHSTSLFLDEPGIGPFIQNLINIDARDLAFGENTDGTRSATIEVLTVAFDSDGTMLAQVARRVPLRPTPKEQALIERLGYTYANRLPLPRPGVYQVRTAVRDAATDRFGTASQLVEAPDLKRGVALTSLVVSAAGAAPNPTVEGDLATTETAATPALRVFRQGGSLEYAVDIHNPESAKGGLSGRVCVLRDGREIYVSPPAPPTPAGAAGSPAVFAGQLKLGAPLTSGDYVLRVDIKELQPRSPRAWSRATDFEIR